MSPQHFYKTKLNVLFLGPSGCGKTLLDRALRHRGMPVATLDVVVWHETGFARQVKDDCRVFGGAAILVRNQSTVLNSADCITVSLTPDDLGKEHPKLAISVKHGDHCYDFQAPFEDAEARGAAADRILAEFPEIRTGRVADNPAIG